MWRVKELRVEMRGRFFWGFFFCFFFFIKFVLKRESEKASFQARLLFFQSVPGGDKMAFPIGGTWAKIIIFL